MKSARSTRLAAVLLILTFTASCASFVGNATKTAGTIDAVVDAGMKAYADLAVAGKVDQATQDKIDKAFSVYVAAKHVAEDAVIAYQKAPDKSAVTVALAALSASAADIVNLLQTLGVKVSL